MSPVPTELKGEMKEAIETAFGSVEDFKKQFSAAGATQFGSGWAWLVVENGKLAIAKTGNAENPITSGTTPILTMDVWEHAYYLGANYNIMSFQVAKLGFCTGLSASANVCQNISRNISKQRSESHSLDQCLSLESPIQRLDFLLFWDCKYSSSYGTIYIHQS